MSNPLLLNQTLDLIDQANSRDPNRERVGEQELPKELVYGRRMSERLAIFAPDASTHLQIAARAQHIERWVNARTDYPAGRSGYKKWRAELGLYHAQRAGEIMADLGYPQSDIERVKFLIQKRQLRRDDETQTLEDVACLVFLEHYLADFAAKHPREKLVDIIQKTWKKMSDSGQQAALALTLPATLEGLVAEALDS